MSDRNYSGAPSFRCLSAPCTKRSSACRLLTLFLSAFISPARGTALGLCSGRSTR